MIAFSTYSMAKNLNWIQWQEDLLFALAAKDRASTLTKEETILRSRLLRSMESELLQSQMKQSYYTIQQICERLDIQGQGVGLLPLCEKIATEFQDLRRVMMREIKGHHFAYIPVERSQYFEQEKLFGEDVYFRFGNLREDIKEVGNCLAADLPTAAVFHLMRIAEKGMQRFADHLKATIEKQRRERKCDNCGFVITQAGKVKVTPIEFAMWDEVLDVLNKKVKELEDDTKGRERSQKFALYYGLIAELERFKNVDRNELMHGRKKYNTSEAIVVFEAVKKFMQLLCDALTEEPKDGSETKPV